MTFDNADDTIELNDGKRIPALGFGVWQVPDDEVTAAAAELGVPVGARQVVLADALPDDRPGRVAHRDRGGAEHRAQVRCGAGDAGVVEPLAQLPGGERGGVQGLVGGAVGVAEETPARAPGADNDLAEHPQ